MALGSVGSLNLAPSGSPLLTTVTCNLCGGESAVVSCSDCDSLHFCSSCDDMYHRHPKRKFHLRKSVTPNASQVQASVTLQAKPMRHDIGHPSNMPIPPPRRKKSFNNLHQQGPNGSLDELANLTCRVNGVNWKTMVNPNTTYVQGLQGSASDAYINESLAGSPLTSPSSMHPMHPPPPPPLSPHQPSAGTTSTPGHSNLYNHHHQPWPPHSSTMHQRSFNVTPTMYASASELSAPSVASESIIAPPANSGTIAAAVTSASIISGPTADGAESQVTTTNGTNNNSNKTPSTIRKRTNSLSRRRNNSLQDLRRDDGRYATMVPFSYHMPPPQLPPLPPGHPYSHYPQYNPYAVHPYSAYWDAYEANELDMNDDESSSESLDDEEEPILMASHRSQRQSQPPSTGRRSASRSRRSSSRNRRSSSRSRAIVDPYGTLGHRSVSTYQLPPHPQAAMWPGYPMPPPPPPPPPHPYYGYPPNYPGYYGSYVHSLASSPPGSIRSSSMARKRSLDNFSTASSIRASDTGHRTGNSGHHRTSARQSLDRINYQRVTNSRNGKAVSASGKTGSIRSLTSSRFGDSDSDDDLLDEGEDFYSASDDAADVQNNGHVTASTEKVHHTKSQASGTSTTGGSKSKRAGNFVKDTQGTCKSNGHRVSGRVRNPPNGQVNEDEDIDDDHFANGKKNGHSSSSASLALHGQWSCKHCTFINSLESAICEVCAKSNPQKLKPMSTTSASNDQQGGENEMHYIINNSNSENSQHGHEGGQISPSAKAKSGKILSVVKAIEAKVKQTQNELHYKSLDRNKLPGQRKESTAKSLSKGGGGGGKKGGPGHLEKGGNEKEEQEQGEEDEDEDEEKPLQVLTLTDDLVVSDELVREQIEIENELRRRRENEKRIERQNKRIEQERRLKVRGENENWTQSNLEGDCELHHDRHGDGDEDEEDEKMANGKVNRRKRNEHPSKRKDGKNKNEHLDENEIEDLGQEEEGEEEDDDDDEAEDEADGENEEGMDLMSSTFGHSSIAPSVSPAEWKRLASKKKNVKRRKVTAKSTFNCNSSKSVPSSSRTSSSAAPAVNCISSSSASSHASSQKSSNSSTTTRGHGTCRTVLEESPASSKEPTGRRSYSSISKAAPGASSSGPGSKSHLGKKEKESFSVQVSVSETGKRQVEETLESLIASLASYKISANQLENVIKNVTQNSTPTSGSMNSCTSSISSSSSSSNKQQQQHQVSNVDAASLKEQILKEALVQKLLLEEQLIKGSADASVNGSTCATNNAHGQSAFAATSAYPVSMLQPPGSIIALHPSQLTASPHAHPHPHPWTQFAPSQQFFGDPNTTLMLMTSQMRAGQRQGPIQSTGNGYYSHFTSINPYATPFPGPASSSPGPASSMSTSITSTCNPVMDNGHLVAQKTAESTSEQGQKLNSKLSSTSSSDLIFGSDGTAPATSASQLSSLSSNTTAAIEMIKILKEAKKKGFTVDEVETALNCNSSKPIEWLEENWSQMVQSVQTLTNNSIILMSQNGPSTIISSSNLIGLKDARCYLRNSRGDIYLAVENALESFKMKNGISDSIIKTTTNALTASSSSSSPSPASPSSASRETGPGPAVTKCSKFVGQSESGHIFQNSALNNQLTHRKDTNDDEDDDDVGNGDDDEDEDDFYSPDEEAIDSLINKWKLERANSEIDDNEICQLFQLTLAQNGLRMQRESKEDQAKQESVTVHQVNNGSSDMSNSQSGKMEVESLRRYLIKKYFGSSASDASSGTSDSTSDVANGGEKVNSTDGQVNDKCVMKKKKVKDGKLNDKDEEDDGGEYDESKSDTNCQLRGKEEYHPHQKKEEDGANEILLRQKKHEMQSNETTGRDEMCKDNNFDDDDDDNEEEEEEEQVEDEEDADEEEDVSFGGTRRDNNNSIKSKCRKGTFTLPRVDDVTADDSKITTTTSSKSSITSEKCTISDSKSKGRKDIQFADGVKDANREETLQGKQLHRQSIKEAKCDPFHGAGLLLHQQQKQHSHSPQTNSTSSHIANVQPGCSLKYEENLDVECGVDIQTTSQGDDFNDQEDIENGQQGQKSVHNQSCDPSSPKAVNWTSTSANGGEGGHEVTTRQAKVNAKSLSITDDTFNGHTSHKSSVKSTTNGLVDPAVSSQNNLRQVGSMSSLAFDCQGSPVSDLTDPVADALMSFEREFKQLYECELCTLDFEIEKMVSMLACQHRACINCVKTYLTIQIRERQCIIIQCPFCTEPSYDPVKDDEEIFTYLSLMDELIKNLLDEETYNLFQRKVRDRSLMKDPSFRWCINCSSGFVASPRPSPTIGSSFASTATCPDCSTVVCIKCNQEWLPQHENVSCEVYSEWKRANDPEFAVKQLNTHLSQFGIDCPSCKFHYELAKGGCMHFHCVQCGYDFCGGCYKRFVSGSECSMSSYCDKMGLHAHHPRNCLFYLRDKEPSVLKQLLDQSNISYNVKFESETSSSSKLKVCPVMEQKRISHGYKDESCGRSTEFAGLCRLHYIEYLGQLIFKNNIDPIDIFELYELELVLKRNNVQVPKTVDKGASNYREVLVELIKEQCPLDPVV